MSKRLPIAAVLCAAAVLPAAADAAEYDYRVTYDVTIVHARESSAASSAPQTLTKSKTGLSTRLTGDYGTVTFRDGHLLTGADRTPVQNANTGTFSSSYFAESTADDKRTCTAGDRTDFQGHGRLEQAPLASLTGESLIARLTDRSATTWTCDGAGNAAPNPDTGWSTSAEAGAGPLDASFDLPFESIGTGKILQKVSGPAAAAGDFCPGDDDDTYSCSIAYDGELTFEKVAERGVIVAPPAETKAPAVVAPVNRPALPVVTARPAPAAPTSARAATVDGHGRLALRATCPAGCTAKATLKVRGKHFTRRFAVPAGGDQRVRVRLPAKARKALRRARRGTLTLRLTPPSGATVTSTVKVRADR